MTFSTVAACSVRGCGNFTGDARGLCRSCWDFAVSGKVNDSQLCRNAFDVASEYIMKADASDPRLGDRPDPVDLKHRVARELFMKARELASWDEVGLKKVGELGLARRITAMLERGGVATVADLASLSASNLLCCPRFGRKSLASVEESLAQHGRKLSNHSRRFGWPPR